MTFKNLPNKIKSAIQKPFKSTTKKKLTKSEIDDSDSSASDSSNATNPLRLSLAAEEVDKDTVTVKQLRAADDKGFVTISKDFIFKQLDRDTVEMLAGLTIDLDLSFGL